MDKSSYKKPSVILRSLLSSRRGISQVKMPKQII